MNVSGGSYTVTVTDSQGCTDVATVNVGSSSSPNLNLTPTATTCGDSNGSIMTVVTSGAGGQTFAWSNGATTQNLFNVAAGSYTVTVTDNQGCTDVASATVGASSSPTVNLTPTATTCGDSNGSIATVAVSYTHLTLPTKRIV